MAKVVWTTGSATPGLEAFGSEAFGSAGLGLGAADDGDSRALGGFGEGL